MDVFKLVCAQCGRDMEIPAAMAGQRGTCPGCGYAFLAPKVGAPLPRHLAVNPDKKKSNAWVILVMVFVGALVGFALALPTPSSLKPTPANATVPPMPSSIRSDSFSQQPVRASVPAMPESIRSENLPRGPMTVPSVPRPEASAESSETQFVYVAPGGAKVYHKRADCPDMHAKDAVGGMELSAAKAGGYNACATCAK